VATIKSRLSRHGYNNVEDSQITFALNSQHAAGDIEKATELLILFQEAVDGIIRPYDPLVEMKGAVNRHAVSCYLDSVLFSMFGRLNAF
jgi:DNA polymerase III gamma/tau subunit